MKYVVNIDWLSIYGTSDLWCADSVRLAEVINYGTASFQFVQLPYGTPQFVKSVNVYPIGANLPIAHLQFCPRSGILHPKAVIIKFSNQLLYTKNLYDMIDMLIYQLHITPKSISRLDVAFDFYRFSNGKSPEWLIRSFMNKNIIRVGRGEGRVFFAQSNKAIEYTGLQFGSKTSIANVYLYNKTKELTDLKSNKHHDKPYIRQSWIDNGLNDDSRDVWRLEISLKPEALRFSDKDTGELLDFTDIASIDKNINLIFKTFADKLFHFVLSDNDNITRCTDIQLLPSELPSVNRTVVNISNPSTISDKVFIKRLMTSRRYEKIRQNPEVFKAAVNVARAVLQSCDLAWWYDIKGNKISDDLPNVKLLDEWYRKNAENSEWFEQTIKFE